jgi:hypothetical protein
MYDKDSPYLEKQRFVCRVAQDSVCKLFNHFQILNQKINIRQFFTKNLELYKFHCLFNYAFPLEFYAVGYQGFIVLGKQII